MFQNKTILITGGTGSLGQALIKRLLKYNPKKIIIYSRDEYKQFRMQQDFNSDKLRFFIGNVRDITRLDQACNEVNYIIHTAALKQIPALEYNPQEAIKTNILGALNVIQVAIDKGIKKVIALSTDKAVNPINLYGASKLCSDKLFVNGNALGKTKFSVVRYGNVADSRGSVIPYFNQLVADGEKTLPITDLRMTRFYITMVEAIELIFTAFKEMQGGEIFVAKIPSFKVIDLIKSMKCKYNIIGIRPGEKLHEVLINSEETLRTYDCDKYYIIQPDFDWMEGRKRKNKKVPKDFIYTSDNNDNWLFKCI